jgi:hypothetical protein
LRTSFGLAAGSPGGCASDRSRDADVTLFAEAARECPLMCVLDNAQWFGRASAKTLAFVARRLEAKSVGLVFAVRTDDRPPQFRGLPQLEIGGLPTDLQQAVAVGESRRSPLALLELSRGLTPAEFQGQASGVRTWCGYPCGRDQGSDRGPPRGRCGPMGPTVIP